jgi:hypothetical protein
MEILILALSLTVMIITLNYIKGAQYLDYSYNNSSSFLYYTLGLSLLIIAGLVIEADLTTIVGVTALTFATFSKIRVDLNTLKVS